MGAWKAIFEGGFNFAASEVRNKLYGTASSVQREEDRSASPSIQEYQHLEGKLKHNSTEEWSGNNWGAIGEWLCCEYERGQREWSWSEYEWGQRLAIASMRILWHSVRLTWKSVDLRRKYTRRTQERRKRPIQCPRPVLCPYLPSSEHTTFSQFWVVSVRKCMVQKFLISYRFDFLDRFFFAVFW